MARALFSSRRKAARIIKHAAKDLKAARDLRTNKPSSPGISRSRPAIAAGRPVGRSVGLFFFLSLLATSVLTQRHAHDNGERRVGGAVRGRGRTQVERYARLSRCIVTLETLTGGGGGGSREGGDSKGGATTMCMSHA